VGVGGAQGGIYLEIAAGLFLKEKMWLARSMGEEGKKGQELNGFRTRLRSFQGPEGWGERGGGTGEESM